MPNYEYKCDYCEVCLIEFRPSIDRDVPATCPACRGVAYRCFLTPPSNTLRSNGTGSSEKEKGWTKQLTEAEKLKTEMDPGGKYAKVDAETSRRIRQEINDLTHVRGKAPKVT